MITETTGCGGGPVADIDTAMQIARARSYSGDPEFPAFDDTLEARLAALQAVLGETAP